MSTPTAVIERLQDALNSHDLERMVACFDPGYRSEQPAHPDRGFGGAAQVRTNWAAMFAGIPDFHADLLGTTGRGDEAWTEWHWTGRHQDGSPFEMRGVTIFGIRDGRIASARLYMEQVERAGAGIDETVRRLAGAE